MPGDFHIASHTFDDIIFSLRNEGYHLDYSYKINHLSFGKKQDHDYIVKHFRDLWLEHPADGISGQPDYIEKDGKDPIPKGIRTIFQFVAVPSYFKRGMSTYHVYQLVANYETRTDDATTYGSSILKFEFEFSPITENIESKRKDLI